VADVRLEALSKSYGDTPAVLDVDVTIAEGEFFSLLGPSGCGKSTTLRMVAGFVEPSAGRVVIGGEDVTRLPPERRDIGIVFQNYAIFPHMHVYDNIAFGLRMRKQSEDEIGRKVKAALEQVEMLGYERRYQRELSGGQQQRVALARVLVTEPRILLLDEPLSALDKKLREEMKYWIVSLQRRLGITTIYVTHDQGEALTMSDRIAVMNAARIEQLGTPRDIYEKPQSRFVTSFIGESNIFDVQVTAIDGPRAVVSLGDLAFHAPVADGLAVGDQAALALRPEHVLLGEDAQAHPDYVRLTGTVRSESYQGALIRYVIGFADQTIVAEAQNRPDRPIYPIGAEVLVAWHPDTSSILTS
jgi:putative spermidine/putrescine transport system ATP-binding protein